MRQRQRQRPSVPTTEHKPSEEELHAQRLRQQTNVSGLAGLQGMDIDDTTDPMVPDVVEHKPITYVPSAHTDAVSAAAEIQQNKRKRDAQDKLYQASVADYDARSKALRPEDAGAEEAARKRRKVEGEAIQKEAAPIIKNLKRERRAMAMEKRLDPKGTKEKEDAYAAWQAEREADHRV